MREPQIAPVGLAVRELRRSEREVIATAWGHESWFTSRDINVSGGAAQVLARLAGMAVFERREVPDPSAACKYRVLFRWTAAGRLWRDTLEESHATS